MRRDQPRAVNNHWSQVHQVHHERSALIVPMTGTGFTDVRWLNPNMATLGNVHLSFSRTDDRCLRVSSHRIGRRWCCSPWPEYHGGWGGSACSFSDFWHVPLRGRSGTWLWVRALPAESPTRPEIKDACNLTRKWFLLKITQDEVF